MKRIQKGIWASLLFSCNTLGLSGCNYLEKSSSDNESSSEQLAPDKSWDVNDISVLYPLRSLKNKSVSRTLPALNNGLMSESLFATTKQMFKDSFGLDFAQGGQAVSMNTLDKWAVVGFRIHNCFRVKVADPCTQQVNIVAQSLVPGETSTSDFAIHLLFQPKVSSAQLVGEMVRIRNTYAQPKNRSLTIGKSIGVHPILSKEGTESEFAKALEREFLQKYLKPEDLKTVAVAFVEPNRLQPWVFFKFDAQNPTRVKNNSIFMFDPGTSVNDCGVQKGRLICEKDLSTGKIVDSGERRAGNPTGNTPKSVTPSGTPYLDDFLFLAQTDKDKRNFSSLKKDLPLWEAVFNRIENPNMIAPEETNCSSCHRTHTDRFRFRGILPMNELTGKNAFRHKGNLGCTAGNGISYNNGIKTFNVRLFGYLHSDPIIAQRVVNETLSVCESLKAEAH